MKKNNQYKIGLIALKYIPILMALSMFIHCILTLLGIKAFFAETIMGCSLFPSILILSLSSIFNFCYIHKCFTIYALIVDICINIDKYIGLEKIRVFLLHLMVLIGAALFILLIVRIKKYKYSCVSLKKLK